MKPYENKALEDLPGEIWRSVSGYEDRYEVSNLGRIKSLPNQRRFTPLILKQVPHKPSGYLQVNLTSHDGVRWRQKVHWVAIIVAKAFHGSGLPGQEVCHNDGDKTNNAESNLRWDTPVANQADRVVHGTANIGRRNPSAKLDEESVRRIKRRLAAGASAKDLASEFSVAVTTIKSIKNGYNWSHIHV